MHRDHFCRGLSTSMNVTYSILSMSAFYHGFPTFVLSFFLLKLIDLFLEFALKWCVFKILIATILNYTRQLCRRMLPLDLLARNLAKEPGFQSWPALDFDFLQLDLDGQRCILASWSSRTGQAISFCPKMTFCNGRNIWTSKTKNCFPPNIQNEAEAVVFLIIIF